MEEVYKQRNNMKSTSSSRIFKTIYHNGGHIMLFRKRQLKDAKFHKNNS